MSLLQKIIIKKISLATALHAKNHFVTHDIYCQCNWCIYNDNIKRQKIVTNFFKDTLDLICQILLGVIISGIFILFANKYISNMIFEFGISLAVLLPDIIPLVVILIILLLLKK